MVLMSYLRPQSLGCYRRHRHRCVKNFLTRLHTCIKRVLLLISRNQPVLTQILLHFPASSPAPPSHVALFQSMIQGSTHHLLCNNSKSKLALLWKVLLHPYTTNIVQLSRRSSEIHYQQCQIHLHNFRVRNSDQFSIEVRKVI